MPKKKPEKKPEAPESQAGGEKRPERKREEPEDSPIPSGKPEEEAPAGESAPGEDDDFFGSLGEDEPSDEARQHYRAGNERYEKGEFDAAIYEYTRAIEYDPAYDRAYYNRGLAFACKEEYDRAIEDITRVIELKPDFAEAYHVLGLAFEYKNEFDKAIEAYNKALELNPGFKDVQTRLELVLSKKSKGGSEGAPSGGAPPTGESKVEEGQIKEVAFLEKPKMNFSSVAGMASMKDVIQKNIVWPFKDPKLAQKYGMKAGGGVLLYGPPGCGKTFIAKATAGECEASFINARISEIVDMYAGNTEKNLHKIFSAGRANAPAIIFFDEVDALGGKRSGDQQQQHLKMAVNQLLTELDGIESSNENILIIAATNMPWEVDPALRRSGRFSSMIYLPPPDFASRKAILQLECKSRPISRIAWNRIALATWGYSSADLKQVVKEAAMIPWETEYKTGKGRDIKTGDFIKVLKKRKSTLPPWYQLVEIEIVGKKETNYVDGKPHVTEKQGKVGPEEKEIYKDLINEIKKGNKIYWKAIKMAVKYACLYVPIPV